MFTLPDVPSGVDDLTGEAVEGFVVVCYARAGNGGSHYWLVQHECGNLYTARRNGEWELPGCAACSTRGGGGGRIIHGMSHTREYRSYSGMMERCQNVNYQKYDRYGGRGIKVCDRWANSFEKFFSDMGERPAGSSLDRIDNDGDYEPNNCRWATPTVQNNNTRRNRRIEYDGRSWTMAELARHSGVSYKTLWNRLTVYGWDVNDAVKRGPSRGVSYRKED